MPAPPPTAPPLDVPNRVVYSRRVDLGKPSGGLLAQPVSVHGNWIVEYSFITVYRTDQDNPIDPVCSIGGEVRMADGVTPAPLDTFYAPHDTRPGAGSGTKTYNMSGTFRVSTSVNCVANATVSASLLLVIKD